MFDFVFLPKEKKKFFEKAKKLGFERVLFVEEFKEEKCLVAGMCREPAGGSFAEAVLIKTDSVKELGKIIEKVAKKYKIVIVLGSNDAVNRAALENNKVNVLLSPHYSRKQDFLHYRNSGLNQVMCKIAFRNNIAIGISFNEIAKIKDSKEKALALGRIMQNIRICRKYKTKIMLASFAEKPGQMKSVYDLRSFAISLGMSTQQAKETLTARFL